jgi:hypothetical protein
MSRTCSDIIRAVIAMQKILLVEDDKTIALGLEYSLVRIALRLLSVTTSVRPSLPSKTRLLPDYPGPGPARWQRLRHMHSRAGSVRGADYFSYRL